MRPEPLWRSTGFFAEKMFTRGPGYLSAAVLYENLVAESYSNPAYDAVLDEANRLTDPAARTLALQRAQRLMLDDQPVIPLYFYVNKHLVKPRVLGYRDQAMNIQYTKNLGIHDAYPSERFDPLHDK